jgi:putative ABC transport system permease protein
MSRDGGLPARRAVIRWAWRLFRREWRRQVAMLALLTVAVTAAVAGASAGYHLMGATGSAAGRLGAR